MSALFQPVFAILIASAALHAQAAGPQAYNYAAQAGVHEVKYFHGCYDSTDQEKRPRIAVVMQHLRFADVSVETRPHVADQPSSEMMTFRLKNSDASFSVQFRSNDGPHCQQGVHSIAFQDRVLHNAAELNAARNAH